MSSAFIERDLQPITVHKNRALQGQPGARGATVLVVFEMPRYTYYASFTCTYKIWRWTAPVLQASVITNWDSQGPNRAFGKCWLSSSRGKSFRTPLVFHHSDYLQVSVAETARKSVQLAETLCGVARRGVAIRSCAAHARVLPENIDLIIASLALCRALNHRHPAGRETHLARIHASPTTVHGY